MMRPAALPGGRPLRHAVRRASPTRASPTMSRFLYLLSMFWLGVLCSDARAEDEPDARRVAAEAMPLHPVLGPLLEDPLFESSDVALQVVDVATGDELYAWDADAALVPASTMKIVTSAAALRTLGPTWRFHTALLHDGEVNAEGVLEGNLYVRGTGDPTPGPGVQDGGRPRGGRCGGDQRGHHPR